MRPFLRKYPVFLFCLPLFFVLHGYRENFQLVPYRDALRLLGLYLFISILLWGAFMLLYRHSIRAAMAAFVLLFVQFFFGPVQDFLKSVFHEAFITRYSFLLPLILIIVIVLLVRFKIKKPPMGNSALYFSSLLIILVLLDGILLISQAAFSNKKERLQHTVQLNKCTDCKQPDIWLIVTDEYAGLQTLDSFFHYDNRPFISALSNRGYFIPEKNHSNYNSTPFSIASLLNMDYLANLKGSQHSKQDISNCYQSIRESRLISWLKDNGYDFKNFSLFDFNNQPSPVAPGLVPRSTGFITSGTLTNRVYKDLGYHLVTTLHLNSLYKQYNLRDQLNNEKIIQLSLAAMHDKKQKPRVIYTHLLLPHYPYYTDRKGNPYDWKSINEYNNDRTRYIEYLQYSNQRILGFVDSVSKSSVHPPIIVLTGDHGFRQWTKPVPDSFLYDNFQAIRLPSGNYSGFYKGISLVNLFRVILNTEFKQQLPMLADSTVTITNKYSQ